MGHTHTQATPHHAPLLGGLSQAWGKWNIGADVCHYILSRTQAPGLAKVMPSSNLTVKFLLPFPSSYILGRQASWSLELEIASITPVYPMVPRLCGQAP